MSFVNHLANARLKVGRAERKLDAMHVELQERLKVNAYDVTVERDRHTHEGALKFRVVVEPDPEWSAEIGEIAHNLRSALNYIVHAVAQPDSRGLSFPIYRDKSLYVQPRGRKRISARDEYLRGVPPAQRAIIDMLQPYNRGDATDEDPLAILAWLVDTDKHREMTVCYALPVWHRLSISTVEHDQSVALFGRLVPGATLEDGTVLLNFATRPDPAAKVKVEVDGQTTLKIVGDSRSIPLDDLWVVKDHVVQVVERLAASVL